MEKVALIILLVSKYLWLLGVIFYVPFCLLMIAGFIYDLILMPNALSGLITMRFIRKEGTDEERHLIGKALAMEETLSGDE